MTAISRKTKGLDSSLKNLSLSPSPKPKSAKTPIAECWEEAASASDDDTSTASNPSGPSTPSATDQTPGPPPPTPSSPTHPRKKGTDWADFPASYNYPTNGAPPTSPPPRSTAIANADKRPEKSSAAAGRMIAGALGVKTPQKTEEGRAYEKAIRETEKRRREKERMEEVRVEREREEARRAVWDG